MKEYHRKWYDENHSSHDRRNKKWVAMHPGDRKVIANRFASSLRGKYNNVKQSAKRRRISFTLSYEQFISVRVGDCFYCGMPLPKTGGGLDRIDNSRSYKVSNVRPCCTNCNIAKRHLSETEFLENIRRIYERHIK